MEKFRKKPVEIQAVLWDGSPESWNAIQDMGCTPIQDESCSMFEMIIPTLEDGSANQVKHIATKGDYIIKGISGEFYPCKPEIFDKTYTKVETTFIDIFIKHGQQMQRREGVEVSSTEELLDEINSDPDFSVLGNMAKEYATFIAKNTLAAAASKFSASHHRDIILATEIVTP